MIILEHVGRVFEGEAGTRVEALRDVSLSIAEGEFVCITGPSGSGKSTLMNILGCLDRPSSGSYQLAGAEVQSLSADGLAWLRRRVFGFVFQSYNLLDSATLQDNVELPGRYAGMSARARRKRAKALLAQLDLEDRAGHLPAELSGGEQQRVAIARALMNGGRVILADEPTGALDRENGEQVLKALEALATKGHTVVVISHSAEIAARADRRIELRDGRVTSDSGALREAAREPEESPSTTEKDPAALSRAAGTLRDSWNALRTNLEKGARLRTAMTVVAILVAVSSSVIVLSIGQGTYRETIRSVNMVGLDAIQVIPENRPSSAQNFSGARSSEPPNFMPLTQGDATAIKDEIANVRAVSPSLYLWPMTVRRGEKTVRLMVRGYVDRGRKSNRGPLEYRLEEGEPITDRDDENLERLAVLEANARKILFPPEENPIGQEILIEDIPFRVKGVFKPRKYRNVDAGNHSIIVPFLAASALLTSGKDFDDLLVFMQNPDRLFETVSEIRDLGIRRRGGDSLIFNHHGAEMKFAKQIRTRLWYLLGAIAGCVLLAGNLSVMNIMLLTVRSRRREIGIRMAVGARRGDIQRQFFGEAIAISLAGAVLGALCALAAIPVLKLFEVAAEPSLLFFAIPIACALIVGTLFGIVPARRAARLDPVIALASD